MEVTMTMNNMVLFFFFFKNEGPHLRHMEAPRPGVKPQPLQKQRRESGCEPHGKSNRVLLKSPLQVGLNYTKNAHRHFNTNSNSKKNVVMVKNMILIRYQKNVPWQSLSEEMLSKNLSKCSSVKTRLPIVLTLHDENTHTCTHRIF